MEYIHIFQVITQILSFFRPQDAERKTQKCPKMNGLPRMVIDFGHIMHLGMTIMAGRDAVSCLGRQDLVGLGLAISPPLLLETGLQITAAAAAAEIIGFVGHHINKVFFTHHGFDNISQIIGNRVTKRFSDQLAGVLNRKFDLSVLVPV